MSNDIVISERVVFARQAPRESVLCISMDCMNSMFYYFDASRCCILARQVPSENDLCMSMECVKSMSDDIDLSRCCILARQGQSENDLKVSKMYLLFMFDEQIDDKAITDTMISPTWPKIATQLTQETPTTTPRGTNYRT